MEDAMAQEPKTARTGSDLVVDGRTARRNRNRDAVLDALIELSREGDGESEPPVEAIADRAGVSYRSIYRYFDDRTDLILSAVRRILGDGFSIFDVDGLGEGSLDDRITGLVHTVLRAHRELGPLTRLVVRLRADEPAVAELYEDVRMRNRSQVATQLAPELAVFAPDERRLVLLAIGTMFQVESLDFLTHHEDLDDAAVTWILTRHIRGHLAVDDG